MSHIRYDYGEGSHFKHAFTYKQSNAHTVHISLQIDDYAGPAEVRIGNETLGFDQIGLGFVSHDEAVNCTAQHCAEGAMFVHSGSTGSAPRMIEHRSILDVAPSILRHFNVAIPAYMAGEGSIPLS